MTATLARDCSAISPPWVVQIGDNGAVFIKPVPGQIIAEFEGPDARAHAELTVHAVNSAIALVSAVRFALECAEQAVPDPVERRAKGERLMVILRAALAGAST